MKEPQETQEGLFIMRWRNLIPMAIMIIAGTNTASIFWQTQKHNSEQIEYNKERVDRKIKNERERDEYLMQIEFLKLKLEECNDDPL